MNIFILDNDPITAAQMSCDKHVVKMVLESAQLLSTVHHEVKSEIAFGLYKPTHVNHPCTIWARKSLQNYDWLCKHALALCKEYTYRYGKVHKSQAIIEWCSKTIPNIPNDGLTDFALAMPEKFKHQDAVAAYRDYYKYEKFRIAKWNKGRNRPDWMTSV